MVAKCAVMAALVDECRFPGGVPGSLLHDFKIQPRLRITGLEEASSESRPGKGGIQQTLSITVNLITTGEAT